METPYFLNPFGVSQKQEEYDEMPIGSIVMWNNTITQSLKNFVPGTTITLREDNGLREFLVVAHDYPSANNNRTLLIRKYAHSSRAWGTSSSGNAYANNSIDTWLNNDYYMLLDSDIRHNIAEVSIPYTIGNGNTSVSTINRSIFLLSATELNFTGYNAEGSVLQIYPSLRIAQNDAGIASDQWTRSPAIANTTYAVKVTSAGAVTTALITSAAYARPAFTLPSTFQFLGNQL
ncbi:MAG: DUF6273 domain-containing protein, partial [Firmicutes bacterium]|nr:DUF6273 domain-containing protein [Bacillota bacterium]